MMTKKLACSILLSAAAVMLLLSQTADGSDKAESKGLLDPWKAAAEVSYVVTGGNTATSAFSIGTSFTRKWTNDSLSFKTFMLRSKAVTTTRTARGTETGFEIIENRVERLAAENYLLSGQYDRRLSKRLLGQVGLSWDRNRFAGVDSRVIMTSGFGYAWIDRNDTQVKTDLNLTYTQRKYIDRKSISFAGLRVNLNAVQKLSKTSSVSTQFIFDENLKRATDWRFDWANSVTASISKSIALKTSLRMLYTRIPALKDIPLFDPDGGATGTTVPVPLKKLDTFWTTSIVVNF